MMMDEDTKKKLAEGLEKYLSESKVAAKDLRKEGLKNPEIFKNMEDAGMVLSKDCEKVTLPLLMWWEMFDHYVKYLKFDNFMKDMTK